MSTEVSHHTPLLSDDARARAAVAHRHAIKDSLENPAHTGLFCDPMFEMRAHLWVIADALAAVRDGTVKRLMVRLPPQTGKTTLSIVWAAFWWLAQRPTDRVVVASYNTDLAEKHGKAVRNLISAHGWRYDLALAYGSASVKDFAVTSGGNVKSVGIGSGLTGFPSDLGLCDDPHKDRQEAESRTYRERVWSWWSSVFSTRQAPGAPIILTMTPWHEDDLSHRVQKQDGLESEGGLWRVIDMPALATKPDDPLGRAYGEPLTHPKIPEEDTAAARAHWEAKRKGIAARDWVSLYLLDPKPMTEALVSVELARERTHLPPPVGPRRYAVGIDPQGGGRDLCGIIAGFLGTDGRVYYTHDWSTTEGPHVWMLQAARLAAEVDADVITIEPNYGKEMAVVLVKNAWAQLKRENPDDPRYRRPPPMIVLATWAKKDKQLRAEPIAQLIRDDRVRFGAYLPEMTSEWTTWRSTDRTSPGRIDGSVYVAAELYPVDADVEVSPPPTTRVAPPPSAPLGRPGMMVNPGLGDLLRGRRPGR